MTPLGTLLHTFRSAAVTEREKGSYFEELIVRYLSHEASYRDLYSQVWRYSDWAREQGLDARDTGIDLVAQTRGTGEFHAIQCKLYAETHRLQKSEIDSFFTASGKRPSPIASSSAAPTCGASTPRRPCATSSRR